MDDRVDRDLRGGVLWLPDTSTALLRNGRLRCRAAAHQPEVLWSERATTPVMRKKRRVEVERKGQGQQTVAWVGGWFALGVTVEEVAGHYSARVGDQ